MIDCEKCKYYHDNCDARFRCRIDIEKIRADAIDECIKLVGGNTKTIVGIVFDNSIPIHDRALGRMAKNKLIEELVEQLEQLKEQKNDDSNLVNSNS